MSHDTSPISDMGTWALIISLEVALCWVLSVFGLSH